MSGSEMEAPRTGSPKLDPEALELSARPRPAIRFRRSVITGIAALLGSSIAGVSWMALGPPSIEFGREEARTIASARPAESLEGAPRDYGEIPKLGPPLPGDLGRPILRYQQRSDQLAATAHQNEPRLKPDREVEQGRASALMVTLSAKPVATVSPSQAGPAHAIEAGGAILSAGTIIPASLITGVNSDLPGVVIAQVTEHVRDTRSGKVILIPQGSRLIGEYDDNIAFGQRRARLIWKQIALPDGRSIMLDNVSASDRSGFAGLEDDVDFHEGKLLKGMAFSALMGAGPELASGGSDNEIVGALRDSAQDGAARAGDQLAIRNLDIRPTIRVRPGWLVLAILTQELALQPWKG